LVIYEIIYLPDIEIQALFYIKNNMSPINPTHIRVYDEGVFLLAFLPPFRLIISFYLDQFLGGRSIPVIQIGMNTNKQQTPEY